MKVGLEKKLGLGEKKHPKGEDGDDKKMGRGEDGPLRKIWGQRKDGMERRCVLGMVNDTRQGGPKEKIGLGIR